MNSANGIDTYASIGAAISSSIVVKMINIKLCFKIFLLSLNEEDTRFLRSPSFLNMVFMNFQTNLNKIKPATELNILPENSNIP